MVAYNFMPRFVPAIQARTKCQTIREPRAQHARPGDKLQLYTGQRTKDCRRIIPDQTCITVEEIKLTVEPGFNSQSAPWLRIYVNGKEMRDVEKFAADDGFRDAYAMQYFFKEIYARTASCSANREPGQSLNFQGVLVKWERRHAQQGRRRSE